jgi:hypothetical protein
MTKRLAISTRPALTATLAHDRIVEKRILDDIGRSL